MYSSVNPEVSGRPRAFDTIVYGGFAVGVLDMLDPIIFWYLRTGAKPIRIFQSVAAGLLGAEARNGGWKTAVLGLVLHFFIAFAIATVYYLASLKLPMLFQMPAFSGMLYGVIVYFIMNYAVIPLSYARRPSFSVAVFLNGVIGHALLVGLPIALVAWRSAKIKRK